MIGDHVISVRIAAKCGYIIVQQLIKLLFDGFENWLINYFGSESVIGNRTADIITIEKQALYSGTRV